MSDELVCWNCGTSLAEVERPLLRLAVCPACDVELHVCRLCRFYDPRVSDRCTEEAAEVAMNKERANFCDYFTPQTGAYTAPDESKAHAAKDQLAALFGDSAGADAAGASDARDELEALFGNKTSDK